MIQLKRIYDKPTSADGERILVDRLWPRGVRKEKARVDVWLKDIAPSPELRRWFQHDPQKWDEFERRYFNEIRTNREALDQIRIRARKGKVTLLYAAKDDDHNNAVALRDYLEHLKE